MQHELQQTGFALLSSAISSQAIDSYQSAVAAAATAHSTRQRLVMLDHQTGVAAFDERTFDHPLNRLADAHWLTPGFGAAVFGAPALVAGLEQALGGASQVLCFETFQMERGPGMRLHRENWYVRLRDVGGPLVTAWILLEDLAEDAGKGGELAYAPGSHKLEGFADSKLHVSAAAHEDVVRRFGFECERLGLKRFLGKKGDVLLTRGDLGVGAYRLSEPSADPVGKVRMIAAHYCALQNDPAYFAQLAPEFRVKRQLTEAFYSSTVYVGRFA